MGTAQGGSVRPLTASRLPAVPCFQLASRDPLPPVMPDLTVHATGRLRLAIAMACGWTLLARAAAAQQGAQAGEGTVPASAFVVGTEPAARRHDVRICAGGDVTLGTNLPTYALRPPAPPRDSRVTPRSTPTARNASRRRRPDAAARPAIAPATDSASASLEPPAIDTIPSPWKAKPTRLLAPLRPLVRDADILLLNVEGAIGEGETATKCGPFSTLCFAFRMPPAAAAAMRELGDGAVVVGNVANNHSRDAGVDGFDSTVAHLERAGVVATGADTLASVAVTERGDTVAYLGFATSGAGTPDMRDLEAVRRHVARAAERWPRLVVTMHAGAEGIGAQRTRDTTERYANGDRGNAVAFARAAVESGADLVIGHGPHVLRAAEWQGAVPVFYSLGNLVTYGPFSNKPPIDRGAIACATLDGNGRARSLVLRPTVQRSAGWVTRDRSHRAWTLVDSLSAIDFPRTGVRVRGDGAVVQRSTKKPKRKKAPAKTSPAKSSPSGRVPAR